MAENGDADLDSLSLSDTEADETEDLFASPSKKQSRPPRAPENTNKSHKEASAPPLDSDEDALADHEERLRHELASLRSMNTVVSGITASLEKAKNNMETVSATVNNASTLLTTWTRILSQTEHNQRLILNPNWHGASQDLVDAENEEVQKQQEQERREAEEERRARQREAEREEEERRRALESTKGTKSKTGRVTGRGTTRGRGYVGVGGQGGTRGTARGNTTGRTASGIGRGLGGSRGRGRGI
ncbi:uncharacterized protein KY384_000696 [Bacidia gigantensis]|uniref:uncharacterized protein n=1 Tax=Bacidia gigantensis TaxID=2732470 RepID=UPI001D03D357|nr:uncharacterized protein KY384_000696 [Bacidia gigantensis]KAG8525934.1 hypothetical protein KY384_000696 [Bacidia gigantensis]